MARELLTFTPISQMRRLRHGAARDRSPCSSVPPRGFPGRVFRFVCTAGRRSRRRLTVEVLICLRYASQFPEEEPMPLADFFFFFKGGREWLLGHGAYIDYL